MRTSDDVITTKAGYVSATPSPSPFQFTVATTNQPAQSAAKRMRSMPVCAAFSGVENVHWQQQQQQQQFYGAKSHSSKSTTAAAPLPVTAGQRALRRLSTNGGGTPTFAAPSPLRHGIVLPLGQQGTPNMFDTPPISEQKRCHRRRSSGSSMLSQGYSSSKRPALATPFSAAAAAAGAAAVLTTPSVQGRTSSNDLLETPLLFSSPDDGDTIQLFSGLNTPAGITAASDDASAATNVPIPFQLDAGITAASGNPSAAPT